MFASETKLLDLAKAMLALLLALREQQTSKHMIFGWTCHCTHTKPRSGPCHAALTLQTLKSLHKENVFHQKLIKFC